MPGARCQRSPISTAPAPRRLEAVADILDKRNITFSIADLSEESRGILSRADVIRTIGPETSLNGREEALRALVGNYDKTGTASAGRTFKA